MQALEILFLGVLAASLVSSTYMVGLFLHRVRAQRIDLDEALSECFTMDEGARKEHYVEARTESLKRVALHRERRMDYCSAGPDLLVVPGSSYAAVMLPMDVGTDHRDLVQCRVYLN